MWPFRSRPERIAQHREAMDLARTILAEYESPEAKLTVPLEYRLPVWARFDSMRQSLEVTDNDSVGDPELLRDLREDIAVVRILAKGTPLDARRWRARVATFNSLFERINQHLIEEDAPKRNHFGSAVESFGRLDLQLGEEALAWFRARDREPGLKLSINAAESLLEKLRAAVKRLPSKPGAPGSR